MRKNGQAGHGAVSWFPERVSYVPGSDADAGERLSSEYGQYTFGTQKGSVSPDGYSLDLYYASTIPDYAEKQSDLIFDYQNNVKLYPVFQEYLRTYQPKLLAIWGKDDPSFIWKGAEAFRKDLPNSRIVPVSSGHFALENCCREIAEEIIDYVKTILSECLPAICF